MLELINNSSIDEQLRDYQLENKLKIYNLWVDNQSVMLQMPTGTGKTRLFASIVKDIHNLSIQNKKAYKVLILAHRQELIKQISENIGIRYGIAHGKIMSKNWEEDFYPTQVASVQTLTRRLDKWGDKKFDFIIIDEAHHALATTYKKICNEFPDAKILGVTATPYRMSKASYRTMFDELIISDSISEFIKKGYLSEYEYYSITPSSKIQNLIDNIIEFDFDGDYAEKALSNTFDKDKIRANLLDTYFKYAEGRKGIIYTINKRHNEHVCNMFIDAGIIARAIDSDTNYEERNRIVKDFKNGNIQILCNVNIFSEGFDCPDISVVQLARPTQSLVLYMQMVGRGLRKKNDGSQALILDNAGLWKKHGLVTKHRKWKLEGVENSAKTISVKNGTGEVEEKEPANVIEVEGLEMQEVATCCSIKTIVIPETPSIEITAHFIKENKEFASYSIKEQQRITLAPFSNILNKSKKTKKPEEIIISAKSLEIPKTWGEKIVWVQEIENVISQENFLGFMAIGWEEKDNNLLLRFLRNNVDINYINNDCWNSYKSNQKYS
jgi:superfamily II DNA or RNA helicase